ncbi:MAG: ABC transporter ATP-binding protein [Acidothermus sp.]|nr:ABC transporter ATP-binding protein [Acidothermus sp.]MCL6538128.1 ABC transporter ATP-binding protein [Acidothermus sp.]
MKALRVEELTVRYGTTVALENVTLDVEEGEILAVLGPSGSGKTTLLGAIAGFIDVTAGRIWIADRLVAAAGHSMPIERRGVGVVFQNYGLWPHLDALDTVAYPLRRQGFSRHEARARARELLSRVGLAGLEGRRPALLSGGQQQRVGLARALACKPRIFLFDEPTANLDSGLRAGLQTQIREQQQQTGAAAVYVTHDPLEAFAVADRIAAIRDARLVQVATPREIYARPADEWIARLTGPCAILSAQVIDESTIRIGDAELSGVSLHGFDRDPGEVRLVVRPEWIRIADDGELPLRATVQSVTFAGAETVCLLTTATGPVTARLAGEVDLHPGDAVSWTIVGASVLAASIRPVVTSS